MARNYNQSCDNCGEILYGQDRGQYVRKDNIFFNGQAGKNTFDPQSGYHSTVFFTKTNAEQTCFCDAECLKEWMDTQEMLWQNRRKAKLREEVESQTTGLPPIRSASYQAPVYTSEDEPKTEPPTKDL